MAVACNPIMRTGASDDVAIDGVGTQAVNLNVFDRTGPVLNASSTPPVTKTVADTLAMVAGAVTLDLTAIAYNGGTVDLTGLKIQMLQITNDNSNSITIAEGAANGYQLMGGASIVLPAGSTFQHYWNDTLPDVAAADAELDITGTLIESLKFVIAAG